jgi:hypothetical protein
MGSKGIHISDSGAAQDRLRCKRAAMTSQHKQRKD